MTPQHDVQAIILTGAGEKAFCTGGDVKQRAETGDYGPTESGMFEIGNLHKIIRDVPKPVIAAVNGLAIGGGHVLQVLCDISIASETARFGQAGLSNLAMSALDLFTKSPEGLEGAWPPLPRSAHRGRAVLCPR